MSPMCSREGETMKNLTRSTAVTALLFLMAALLLVFGSVGGARAALNLQSDIYESQFETTSINVAITESGEVVSNVMMLSSGDMVSRAGNPPDKAFKIGKEYDLPLSVTNNGGIDEYVRVTVYQYWVSPSGTAASTGWFDGSGTKDRSLDPGLIKLVFSDGWTLDADASATPERTVYYRAEVLKPGESAQFLKTVSVDKNIVKLVEVNPETGKYVYTYDGKGFVLEIQADAVQTHNGDAARISSWGQKGT